MRVFRIQSDNTFVEFDEAPFDAEHDESELENWLEENPEGILENNSGILIIGRQVRTSLGGFIDLLGVDRKGDMVVIELKRDKTPRETIAQALEYASFIDRLDYIELEEISRSYMKDETLNLAEFHRDRYELESDDAVAFNKDQHIVLVGQRITAGIRQTEEFLGSKGVRVTCVEFTYFQTSNGKDRLMSRETVVESDGVKTTPSSSISKPVINANKLLSFCNDYGKVIFSRFLDWTEEKKLAIVWGSRGCTINVRINETNVGFLWLTTTNTPLKQYIYVGLKDKRFFGKSAVPDETVEALWNEGMATGLFTETNQYLKHQITRNLTENEQNTLIQYCETVAETIERFGLRS